MQACKRFNLLKKRGIYSIIEKEVPRIPAWMRFEGSPSNTAPEYHPFQAQAVETLRKVILKEAYQTYALYGVTGSGKTEVYLAALESVFSLNKTAIVLVPEISLTPQTVRRFQYRFGDTVAVLHSRMSQGERHDVWQEIRSGRYRVVIGPRSAILSPLKNLGLVIVDEEHDGSYKQRDTAPRYHARDVAVMRAMMAQCVCILGSATLSLETQANAKNGKYTLLSMPERAPSKQGSAASFPTVRIIDLCKEHEDGHLAGPLSSPLIEAIGIRLQRKEQVILLQNRRGYAPILECQSCGMVPQCIACSVSMTYHLGERLLRCHYCGYTQPVLIDCPKCSAATFAPLGSGTQRVMEELSELFKTARILRMDRDSTRTKDAHHEILKVFAEGEADILIGTQMVAKGLDFGRVTLVGVINCDLGLRLPDFRSEERTFQLLTQVAGRSGRAHLPGEVILQTRRPLHPIFSYIQSHDFDGYTEILMRDRQRLNYPPFGRIVGIQVRGTPKPAVEKLAMEWKQRLLEILPSSVSVLGPEQSYIERVGTSISLFSHPQGSQDLSISSGGYPSSSSNGFFPRRDLHVAVNVDGLEQN